VAKPGKGCPVHELHVGIAHDDRQRLMVMSPGRFRWQSVRQQQIHKQLQAHFPLLRLTQQYNGCKLTLFLVVESAEDGL
jgi:hypothetical protein